MFLFETESAVMPEAGPSLVGKIAAIHRERKTGQLHLMQGSRLASVWFSDGGISHADGLPEILKGAVSSEPPGGFTGDLMADLGNAIAGGTPPEEVLRAAHRGIVGVLADAGLAFDSNWGFQEGVTPPPGSMPLPGDVMKDLIAALEANPLLETLKSQLLTWKGHELRVEGKILPTDGFPPVALRVYRLAAKGRTLEETLKEIGGDEARQTLALRSVAMLRTLELIHFSDHPKAEAQRNEPVESESTTADSQASHAHSPPQRKRATGSTAKIQKVPDDPDALFKRAAEVEAMNPLLAIGLDPDEVSEAITPEVVRAAFRREATVYHPDRLRELSVESQEAAEAVFTAFNELRNLIASQEDIELCIKKLQQERSGIREITDFDRERARVMGRKAAGYMRHKKWRPGLELIRQAKELDPENVMLLLWEHFGEGILKEVPYAEAAQKILELDIEGRKDRAERLYRAGCLWRLAGKEKQALRCFMDAVAALPSHAEAQTELRVLQKRQAETAEKVESNIPFARFFKKKTP